MLCLTSRGHFVDIDIKICREGRNVTENEAINPYHVIRGKLGRCNSGGVDCFGSRLPSVPVDSFLLIVL